MPSTLSAGYPVTIMYGHGANVQVIPATKYVAALAAGSALTLISPIAANYGMILQIDYTETSPHTLQVLQNAVEDKRHESINGISHPLKNGPWYVGKAGQAISIKSDVDVTAIELIVFDSSVVIV